MAGSLALCWEYCPTDAAGSLLQTVCKYEDLVQEQVISVGTCLICNFSGTYIEFDVWA